jgi:hypothetical protein
MNKKVNIDWQSEVIKLVELHFKKFGIVYPLTVDVHTALVDFMNLESKLIKPTKRIVFKSDSFKSRKIPPAVTKALNLIEQKITAGIDITYHQSKKTLDPKYNDLLFNNWIIHHIHLSNTISRKHEQFYDRSKFLLFAAFSVNQAVFIDIRDHNESNGFAQKELLEIILRNWPQLLEIDSRVDAAHFTSPMTNAEIDGLRRKGYMLGSTQVGDKIIINPGLGNTSSGHNVHTVRRANAALRLLYECLEEIEKDYEELKMEIEKNVGRKINALNLEVRRVDEWPYFVIYENQIESNIFKDYEV